MEQSIKVYVKVWVISHPRHSVKALSLLSHAHAQQIKFLLGRALAENKSINMWVVG